MLEEVVVVEGWVGVVGLWDGVGSGVAARGGKEAFEEVGELFVPGASGVDGFVVVVSGPGWVGAGEPLPRRFDGGFGNDVAFETGVGEGLLKVVDNLIKKNIA
ncbi:MAG: hypothetical protein NC484_03555 [Alloprevotella sp.]|nr:hypothetical protein [Alloprevotella sp.]